MTKRKNLDPALKSVLGIEKDVIAGEKRLGRLGRVGLTRSGRENRKYIRDNLSNAEKTIAKNRDQGRLIRAFIETSGPETGDYSYEKSKVAALDKKQDPKLYP